MRLFHVTAMVLAGAALTGLVACGGGGGGSSAGSGSGTGVVVDDPTTTTTVIDTGTTIVDDTPPVDTSTVDSDDGGGYGGYDDGSASAGDPSGCDDSGCNSFSNGGSKDTNLSKARAQQKVAQDRAQGLANRFNMSAQSAYQLTQLADQVKAMSVQGQLTEADQQAIAQSAFAIGGVSADEVKAAVQGVRNGDKSQAEELMSRAAAKMGMSSGAEFRDRVLPAVGVKF